MNIDYVVPSYSEFAAHMLAQPQPYGLDAVTSVPVAPETLHASLAVYDRKLRSLDHVREKMVDGIEEQLGELETVSEQMDSLMRHRNALMRKCDSPLSIIEEADASSVGWLGRIPEAPVPRRRPWYRTPFNRIERAIQKYRDERRRMRKIVVPYYAHYAMAEALADQEWYRVQNLFDNANPKKLKKLLKDPYYRKYYDGEVSYSFWGY